ncbi:Pectate trisaccharide-lyase precursor [Vibrio aerogenes CECT 7868]|uniref:Pectate trisaccharide-lyase n=1 Tax=Vibrio aerogenes CECT 7868 TaxID=1216006 RepID=A0A1M5UH95_9VIBR|nr:RICIN domain-containing protein [Vibrio aerogenes]SHH62196.1 Pectate trisaccharide-lyase precursor [Vibrio aerogenes CECT 7868]
MILKKIIPGMLLLGVIGQVWAADLPEGRYVIYAKHSGRAFDITAGSKENGAKLQQWGYSGSKWQQFDLMYEGDGYYSLRSANSGKALDVKAHSTASGADIIQYTFRGNDNQLWKLNDRGNGYYTIISKHSGKAMDVWGRSTKSGAAIRQGTLTNKDNQLFRFESVDGGSSGGSTGGQPRSDKADGFAGQNGGTTGGKGGKTVTVNSCGELKSALNKSEPLIIQIPDKTLDCRTANRKQQACKVKCSGKNKYTYRIPTTNQSCRDLGSSNNSTVTKYRNETRLNVASNKTIVGLGPKSTVRGGSFNVDGKSNLIFRNFTITDINPGLVEASDGISVKNVKHLWIDHMGFSQISDGYVDMYGSKNVTFSWNHFNGYNTASCDNHHSYVMFANDSQVTYHHNFFDQGGGRNPKLDKQGTRAHLYNNYWKGITYFATNVNSGAEALVEGNYYKNVKRPHWNNGGAIDARKSTNVYSGTSTSTGADSGDSVFRDISMYPYKMDKAADLPARLTSGTGPQ